MQTRTVFIVIVALLLLPMSAMGAGAVSPTPAFHEEITRAWDEIGRHLHEMGSRWYDHFAQGEAREERPLITFMLRHRDQLALSSDQVQGLERLRNDFQREAIKSDADLRIAEIDLSNLLGTDPVDLPKVDTKVREIERLKADLRLSRIRTIEKGKALLSAEQRAKLNDLIGGSRYSRLQGKE